MDCSLELLQASVQLLPKCGSIRQSPCYITSVVDWALTIKSIYMYPSGQAARHISSEGACNPVPGCTTTSQSIYCQGGRKSASFVQLRPDACSPRLGDNFCRAKPTFWDSDSLNSKCHGRQLAPSRCDHVGGSVWVGRCRATYPSPVECDWLSAQSDDTGRKGWGLSSAYIAPSGQVVHLIHSRNVQSFRPRPHYEL